MARSREDRESLKVISRNEIEARIHEGDILVIFDGLCLKLNTWVKFHPGGDKAIYHMVGRDATDEINAYHAASTIKRMANFRIGRIVGDWVNFVPPIQEGKFRSQQQIWLDEKEKEGSSFIVSNDSHLNDASDEASSSECDVFSGNSSILNSPASSLDNPNSEDVELDSIIFDPSIITSVQPVEPKSVERFINDYEETLLSKAISQLPGLDSPTQKLITERYRVLHEDLQKGGYFQCNYWAYFREVCRYTLFFAASMYFLHRKWYMTSAFFLGVFWHQLVFCAHDAGHLAITHNFIIDNVLGVIIADFFGGLSLGWWKRNHNVHHLVPNDPIHDPDIQHLPFFAVSTKLLGNVFSTFYERVLAYDAFAKVLLLVQNYTYYPILCFGRFNLYRLSWEYLILGLGPRRGQAAWIRWFEVVGQVFFWYWFGYVIMTKSLPDFKTRLGYLLISHIVTMPVHVQITLSHFSMSTSDLGPVESFSQRQLRTTMDVDCPEWLDFFHGGLQFQAVHHLFPRLPRHNLRRAQKLVIQFCKDVGIRYTIYGFYDGNREIIGRLAEIAKQAKFMAACNKALQEETLAETYSQSHVGHIAKPTKVD